MSQIVQPWYLDVPESVFVDLRYRLNNARMPEGSPYPGWQQGTSERLKLVGT